jgi:hypothetical protein
LKLREKSEEDENPHSSATSVSERLGAWDIRYSARSSRCRFTNSNKVSPIRDLNTRWKWNGEKQAARATSSSCRLPSRFRTT